LTSTIGAGSLSARPNNRTEEARTMKVLTRVALALSVLAGIAASPAAAATREVVVTVVDAAGKPVAGAEVVVAAERESRPRPPRSR
jgi:hypothetical protein